MPSETAEPTYGAQSCGCVFIKALQSKDFSEILLICVNFLVIVHGSTDFSGKIDILFSGHKKYYGRITILGMGSLSYILKKVPHCHQCDTLKSKSHKECKII